MTQKSTDNEHLSTTNMTTHKNDTFTFDPGITCLFSPAEEQQRHQNGKSTHNRSTSVTNMQDFFLETVTLFSTGGGDDVDEQTDADKALNIRKPNLETVAFRSKKRGKSCMS